MISQTPTDITKSDVYGCLVKNGNKLTIVYACNIETASALPASGQKFFCNIVIPASVGQKLFVSIGGYTLDRRMVSAVSVDSSTPDVQIAGACQKGSDTSLFIVIDNRQLNNLVVGKNYYVRFEFTFLLSDSLV